MDYIPRQQASDLPFDGSDIILRYTLEHPALPYAFEDTLEQWSVAVLRYHGEDGCQQCPADGGLCRFEDGTPIGAMEFVRIRDYTRDRAWEAADSHTGDIEKIVSVRTDPAYAMTPGLHWSPEFEERIDCPVGDLLIMDRAFIEPQWRGFGLGALADHDRAVCIDARVGKVPLGQGLAGDLRADLGQGSQVPLTLAPTFRELPELQRHERPALRSGRQYEPSIAFRPLSVHAAYPVGLCEVHFPASVDLGFQNRTVLDRRRGISLQANRERALRVAAHLIFDGRCTRATEAVSERFTPSEAAGCLRSASINVCQVQILSDSVIGTGEVYESHAVL
ncbi:hypothetical protein [Streptomyces sp. NPDC059918]|uniref:hypothetical protein n=1 Tax=unclassified Streptomyces TaxID=2593676 RepID=UPI003653AAC9